MNKNDCINLGYILSQFVARERAQCQFGRMSDVELDKEYKESGNTGRLMFDECKAKKDELQAAKEWFLSAT